MKISITTDDGEVVDILKAEDIGDLRFPMARAELIEQIRQSWIKASAMEEGRQPTPRATQVEVSPEAACAAEFGYRCGEKGMNVQAMQEELAKVMKGERPGTAGRHAPRDDMSNRGVIYTGPGGEELHGDGRPVNTNDFLASLYRVKPEEMAVFGDNWCSTVSAFEHGKRHRVAFYQRDFSDGQDVNVYVDASPARFYAIEAVAMDNKPSWTLVTGSDMAKLVHQIAIAIAGGMLALDDVAGERLVSVS